jgi:hypothetical protein
MIRWRRKKGESTSLRTLAEGVSFPGNTGLLMTIFALTFEQLRGVWFLYTIQTQRDPIFLHGSPSFGCIELVCWPLLMSSFGAGTQIPCSVLMFRSVHGNPLMGVVMMGWATTFFVMFGSFMQNRLLKSLPYIMKTRVQRTVFRGIENW